MRKYFFIVCCFVIALSSYGCGGSSSDDPVVPVPKEKEKDIIEPGATTFTLKGYEDNVAGTVFQPSGFNSPFYIKDKTFYGAAFRFVEDTAARLDAMSAIPSSGWKESVSITVNKCYWARYSDATSIRYVKFRVVKISGNEVVIAYILDKTDIRANVNANTSTKASAKEFEIPHLNAENTYVDHYVTYNNASIMNLAIEWIADKKHSNWVAFYYDAVTAADNVSRTDAWAVDTALPSSMQVTEDNHKSDGFDKGHLCASEDRSYCREANQQTFLYSNISPQLNAFNGGFWQSLESRVRIWGRSCANGTYDKVYIVKGGTMNSLLVNYKSNKKAQDGQYPTTTAEGKTIKGLACPKYYFMAILAEKNDSYQAIGFFVEHREDLTMNPKSDELKKYAVSIDDLEKKTGIDFFCNLLDDIEDEVEAKLTVSQWKW